MQQGKGTASEVGETRGEQKPSCGTLAAIAIIVEELDLFEKSAGGVHAYLGRSIRGRRGRAITLLDQILMNSNASLNQVVESRTFASL